MRAPKGRRSPAVTVPAGTAAPLVCGLLLILAVLAVYAQTAGHDFIPFDDDVYVYDNAIVKAGITVSNLIWALTTFSASNWHPLTWISYMLDCQIFGPAPGPMHLVNVAWHAAGTVLLFAALRRMTRRTGRAAVVAGIFALHPLHVESVAWIAERKDVLSTCFEMLAMLLYARYCESPSVKRYAGVTAAFALSLLSKPMAVTFPFLLLVLDFWPLRRLAWPRAVLEKAPWFAMAAVGSVLTFLAQQRSGAVASLAHKPLAARAGNAAVAYIAYLAKAAVPANLAVFYPYRVPAFGVAAGAAVLLAAATWFAVVSIRRRPYVTAGWFWYLGTLVPVIGLVQVGNQAMADRYTYLPLAGIAIAVVWAAADALPRRAAAILAAVVLLASGVLCYRQVQYWKNGETLFDHTLAITQGNFTIENNLANLRAKQGRLQEAAALYRRAAAVQPNSIDVQANLGRNLLRLGQFQEAYSHLTAALRIEPGRISVHEDLGVYWVAQGNYEESSREFLEALRLGSTNPETHNNLCFVLQRIGRTAEAVAHCSEALRLRPAYPDAHFNWGTALASQGQTAEAIAEFRRALALDPAHAGARAALEAIGGR